MNDTEVIEGPTYQQKYDAWETLELIEALDEAGTFHWEQSVWAEYRSFDNVFEDGLLPDPEMDDPTNYCGFIGCFAGWRAALDGGRLITNNTVKLPSGQIIGGLLTSGGIGWNDWLHERLGLEDHQTPALISGSNDLDELRHYVYDYFGPRPASLKAPDVKLWLDKAINTKPVDDV